MISDEMKSFLTEAVQERISFNKLLGIRVESLEPGDVCIKVQMRDELVGNFTLGTLHGGAISSILDAVGGLTAWIGVLERIEAGPVEKTMKRFSRLGTIDIRVDYLRPGRGDVFYATGTVLRTGNKVAVTRMELRDEEDLLIAVGTGTYIVG